MNWEMIGVVVGVIVIQGGVLIAAAKSIFVTKTEHDGDIKDFNSKHDGDIKDFNSKLYDKGITIFVSKQEWESSKTDRERRRDLNQRDICNKIQKMRESMDCFWNAQNKTNESICHLLGRFEQYLEKTEKKEGC